MDSENVNDMYDSSELEVLNRDSRIYYSDKKAKRRVRLILLAVASGIILLAGTLLLTAYLFFRINTVSVEGNTYYDSEYLLSVMGVNEGESIFLADQNKYAKKLAGTCPMVYSVRVDKVYPDEIKIVITEEIPSYYFYFQGLCSVVSESGKVLYTGEELDDFPYAEGLVKVTPPPVLEAVMGYAVKYKDSMDKNAVADVIRAIERSPLADMVKEIEMTSRFDIRLFYGNRFQILIGSRQDISVKLKFADKIIEELKETDSGQINVKNGKDGYAILD